MTRKKVKLAWIVGDSARKTSLKKRRVGLLKKVSELATLCGVSAFVIVYSPDDNEPAVWPSCPMVEQLLARFQSLPEIERSKKLINQETYLKEKVAKEHEQYKKLNKKNLEVEMCHLLSQIYNGKTLDEFHISELHGLAWFMVEKMKEIRKRVNYFQQVPLPPGSLPLQGPEPRDNMGRIGSNGGDENTTTNALIDQWLMDIHSENVIGNSSVRRDIRIPHSNTYVGSSSVANDMGLLPHGTFRGHTVGSGMGLLPHGNTGGSSSGNIMGLGLGIQPEGNIGGNSSTNDIGLVQQLHGTGGVSTTGNEIGLPLGIFGDSNGGSDIGLPFDVSKINWPSNFSP